MGVQKEVGGLNSSFLKAHPSLLAAFLQNLPAFSLRGQVLRSALEKCDGFLGLVAVRFEESSQLRRVKAVDGQYFGSQALGRLPGQFGAGIRQMEIDEQGYVETVNGDLLRRDLFCTAATVRYEHASKQRGNENP